MWSLRTQCVVGQRGLESDGSMAASLGAEVGCSVWRWRRHPGHLETVYQQLHPIQSGRRAARSYFASNWPEVRDHGHNLDADLGRGRVPSTLEARILNDKGRAMGFHIRDAQDDDVSAPARLHVQTFNETHCGGREGGPSYELRERQWRELFAANDGSSFCLLAQDDGGDLVGLREERHMLAVCLVLRAS